MNDLVTKCKEIRKLVLDMCCKAKTGHVTSSFSCVEIFIALYYGGFLRFRSGEPRWADRDRFVLSKGQASPILYVILADLGFFPRKDLDKFCQKDGKFGVHLQHSVPGVEITSGSLGHGFGIAAGMALAAKMNRENHLVYTLLGDGECYEGSIWETALFCSACHLNNLIAIIDRNYICATNFTESSVPLEPLEQKWEAFGWRTKRVNGHSLSDLLWALDGERSRRTPEPLVIIADTIKGKGIPFIEDDPMWHANAPKDDDIQRAYKELEETL